MTLDSETSPKTGPEEEVVTDILCAETIGIGLRLPTQNRQCLKDWWKPWDLIRSQDKDEDEDAPHT